MTTRPEESQERRLNVVGWPVNLTNYRLGGEWHCKVDTFRPAPHLYAPRVQRAKSIRQGRVHDGRPRFSLARKCEDERFKLTASTRNE